MTSWSSFKSVFRFLFQRYKAVRGGGGGGQGGGSGQGGEEEEETAPKSEL